MEVVESFGEVVRSHLDSLDHILHRWFIYVPVGPAHLNHDIRCEVTRVIAWCNGFDLQSTSELVDSVGSSGHPNEVSNISPIRQVKGNGRQDPRCEDVIDVLAGSSKACYIVLADWRFLERRLEQIIQVLMKLTNGMQSAMVSTISTGSDVILAIASCWWLESGQHLNLQTWTARPIRN